MEINDKKLKIILSTEKEKKENAKKANDYIIHLVSDFYNLKASKKTIKTEIPNTIVYKLDDGFIDDAEFKKNTNMAFSGCMSANISHLFMDGFIHEKDITDLKIDKAILIDLKKIQGSDSLTFTIVKYEGSYYLEIIKGN